jgi:aryl-alcohol dehydrogenase-like predicted oxidoreductase
LSITTTDYRRLGKSELLVSPLAVGCWAIADETNWGPQDHDQAVSALRWAYEQGVNFFDTAEGYGAGLSETLVARALGDVRRDVVIGTKVSPAHAATWPALEEACTRSLRNLDTDYIDVYHLHWPCRVCPLEQVVEGMLRLRQRGWIREFAVSNFGPNDLTEVLNHAVPVANQLPYNLLWRPVEHEILPLCREAGVGVTAYSPLMQGLLTGKFATPESVPPRRARTRLFSCTRPCAEHGEAGCEQEAFAALTRVVGLARRMEVTPAELALAWLLHQDGVTAALVGVRNRDHVRRNLPAVDLELPRDVLDELEQISRPVADHCGTNPDMWQSRSRFR